MTESPKFVVGADLGGTNVRAAVVDAATGRIVARSANHDSRALEGAEATARQIASAVEEAVAGSAVGLAHIYGVGLAVPGHVHPADGMVLWAPNFLNQWRGVPLGKLVGDRLGLRVTLGNDANLAALGEFEYGAGASVRHLAMITLGTGVGGGIIIDGELLLGADGGAGEVGHMIVNPGGRGGFAAFGTVEGEAQRDAITERAERKIQQGRVTMLAQEADWDRHQLTPALIAKAAAEGDAVALEVFAETGYYVGLCAANLINLLNPEMIVIGGGIIQAGEILMEPIRRAATACAVRSLSRTCRIVAADLGDNAGILGGAALAGRARD